MKHNEKLRKENELLRKEIEMLSGQVHIQEGMDERILNQFLKNILEFHNKEKKLIKIFEKIGSPSNIEAVNNIPDEKIDQAWNYLSGILLQNGISLDASSPNVTARELYRFTTEELFKEDVDANAPSGMMQCFIYDEFHPDHAYENERCVVDDCIQMLFNKNELYDFNFSDKITINQHKKLQWSDFITLINNYRSGFDSAMEIDIKVNSSILQKDAAEVTGSYETLFIRPHKQEVISGQWRVGLIPKGEYWMINNIQIEGLLI
jgi:hypothetical protein